MEFTLVVMYWWEKSTPRDLLESYHCDEQDAKEFASQGLHKEASMLFDCAAQQRIKHAKLNHKSGLDQRHYKAWVYCKKRSEKHKWLSKIKK